MKVIRVNSEKVRFLIEEYSRKYTFPDLIQFVQDGAGNYIVGTSVLDPLMGKRYVREDKQKLEAEATLTKTVLTKSTDELDSIAKLIIEYGEEIDYIPLPDEELNEETKK
jgi:hypothetical protein